MSLAFALAPHCCLATDVFKSMKFLKSMHTQNCSLCLLFNSGEHKIYHFFRSLHHPMCSIIPDVQSESRLELFLFLLASQSIWRRSACPTAIAKHCTVSEVLSRCVSATAEPPSFLCSLFLLLLSERTCL